MRSEDEIRERINYFEQRIIKDVTTGIINIDSLKYDRAVLETLRYVLDEEDNQ